MMMIDDDDDVYDDDYEETFAYHDCIVKITSMPFEENDINCM